MAISPPSPSPRGARSGRSCGKNRKESQLRRFRSRAGLMRRGGDGASKLTHSSLIKLLIEMPPQLIPPIMLPARPLTARAIHILAVWIRHRDGFGTCADK